MALLIGGSMAVIHDKYMHNRVFNWLDQNSHKGYGWAMNQAMPLLICAILLTIFILLSYFFIAKIINPFSAEAVNFKLNTEDVIAGFMLYFFTAVDYALIVGRMQTANPGSKARFVMNFYTCIGCFVGVSLVLFMWGFAKEFPWLIIPVLIFAGSVMFKLAHEGQHYFAKSRKIPGIVRTITLFLSNALYYATSKLTAWMPELSVPNAAKMSISKLAKWSFLLPFIIGIDDLVGYMGAMTVYNAFGLIVGIYIADVVIDLMIFVFPKFTTKLVENPFLSLFGAYAFLYLGYKSFSESFNLLHEHYNEIGFGVIIALIGISVILYFDELKKRKFKLESAE